MQLWILYEMEANTSAFPVGFSLELGVLLLMASYWSALVVYIAVVSLSVLNIQPLTNSFNCNGQGDFPAGPMGHKMRMRGEKMAKGSDVLVNF